MIEWFTQFIEMILFQALTAVMINYILIAPVLIIKCYDFRT
jgi:hypothetical protein